MTYYPDPYELKLVDDCLENNIHAQKQLYDRYKDAMYTILFRFLDDENEAADALQEAFIEIFHSLSRFKHQSTLGAWIKVIVIRKGIYRQKKKLPFLESLDQKEVKDKSIQWDENLTGEYLAQGIRKLPTGYKSIFLLVEVEGYTHKEVARLLNIKEGTSKSQLYHAKRLLQKILKEMKPC